MLGLIAAFFAWQSAEPLWLALGRGEPGTATVGQCDPTGAVATPTAPTAPTYRCVSFHAASGAFHATDVTLRGAGASATEGTRMPARMISADRGRAYVANPAGLHLRWAVGLLLVLGCGAGIAWVSGATRLDEPRSRRRAVLLSVAGPVVLAAGFLGAAL